LRHVASLCVIENRKPSLTPAKPSAKPSTDEAA
jgi:hypothetical protein